MCLSLKSKFISLMKKSMYKLKALNFIAVEQFIDIILVNPGFNDKFFVFY